MKTQNGVQISRWVFSFIFAGTFIGACASSGTEPHAMTAGQHQAAAQTEEQAAAQHHAQYDPSQTKPTPGPSRPSMGAYSACIEYQTSNCYVRWKSTENATERHIKDAQKHKRLAEKHRAASKILVDAEQRFCSGIPEADRDVSPFYHREDISAAEGVTKLEGGYGSFEGNKIVQIQQIEKDVFGPGGLQGARITFRAVPGMTGEWLQRAVHCHLARNAVVGSDATMGFCPLAVPRASAVVTSTGQGFAVDITSDDEKSASEIVKRAWALGPAGSTVLK